MGIPLVEGTITKDYWMNSDFFNNFKVKYPHLVNELIYLIGKIMEKLA
jgi:hypothetical protein